MAQRKGTKQLNPLGRDRASSQEDVELDAASDSSDSEISERSEVDSEDNDDRVSGVTANPVTLPGGTTAPFSSAASNFGDVAMDDADDDEPLIVDNTIVGLLTPISITERRKRENNGMISIKCHPATMT